MSTPLSCGPLVPDMRGTLLHSVNLPAPRGDNWDGGLAAPTVAQIDADPEFEVVIGTSQSGVVAYQIPGSANARVLWGTARGNLLRNGLAPPNTPSSVNVLFRSGFE